MASPSDLLTRRVLPSTVIVLSRLDLPARAGATARRALGRRGRVELFFAFDDPASAVAVIDLAQRVSRRDVLLDLRPVVERGIEDDPAVEHKRRYAIADARRLGRRAGLELSRDEPLAAGETAFLAEWVAACLPGPALTGFCAEAMRRLWFETGGEVERESYAASWRERLGSEPPAGGAGAVRRNERLMARRGPYDTPAAWVHGQWFFAQDRPAQIASRLDELGWTLAR